MAGKEFYDLAEAQLNLSSHSKSYWGNLGLWRADTPAAQQDYAQACTRLAKLVGDLAQLNPQDQVIDIGFGCGDQLLLWLQDYAVEQLYGLNISSSQTQLSQQRLAEAGFCQQAQQCRQGSYADMLKWASSTLSAPPSKIIALDCAYHFRDRQQFLAHSHTLLAPQGQTVLCDLLLGSNTLSLKNRLVLKTLCRVCNIPYKNLLKKVHYMARCEALGFEVVDFIDITEHVFLPFGEWLYTYRHAHCDKGLHWGKYTGTAWFLRWAKQQGILRYVVVNLRKK